MLEQAQNLPKSILLGLKQSFQLNHTERPYLFLAECLFYALACQHNKHQGYIELDFSQETEVVARPLEELVSKATGYSKRIKQELNRFSEDELNLFRRIAPFTFYDESFDELSGEYVLDYYLISHADFLDLFTKYGIKGNDISRLKEYGLISGGGRHEMIVEKGELSGFQNDNLVLTFSTDSDERITFEYSAFHLTDTAKALIEILEIGTDDEFFQGLADNFKERLAGIDVKFPKPILPEAGKVKCKCSCDFDASSSNKRSRYVRIFVNDGICEFDVHFMINFHTSFVFGMLYS